MNEVMNLSNDINVITAEINSYKQMVGQSFFEIGRRLKHVKENDLIHGDFLNWVVSLGIHPRVAQQMMRVASDSQLNTSTYSHLGLRVLYEIATISPEEREEPHTIPSTGEEKTVDAMTVREIREVKKALKEKEKQLQQAEEKAKLAQKEATQARKYEQLTRKQLEELEQQEPQIIEREVVKEVEIESKEHINIINELTDKNAELKDTADFYKQKADALSKDVDDIQLEESSMNYIANKNVHNLIAYMDEFLKDVVVSSLMRGSIATASDATKELLDSRIEAFQEFLNDLKIAKTGRKIN
ncbi:hypothetical protein [Bacillus cereus]|uniref:hypothetical protein n=1 Tax=Bacillus cereus TaxID=1396 RepID=UPI000BED2416|nr:hypothetical protein [Bacillus cereus]PEE38017.1 hypothetical protein CON59_06370 [Bacillus cereus]PET41680.1 hypothetical protein CN523_23085 [Bacillus cereus]PFA54793.1 hypothetical protein CN389_18500 [Bacillus cereus]PFD70234.1 hypothetical protein CN271_18130 [Bacillus cereus]PFE82688.1 hypothetical protein CN319_03620 [Bacillus cereus]